MAEIKKARKRSGLWARKRDFLVGWQRGWQKQEIVLSPGLSQFFPVAEALMMSFMKIWKKF